MNSKYLLISLFIITNLLCSFAADGQPLVEADLKTLFDPAEKVHQDYTKPIKESKNEIDVTIATTFLLYSKSFVKRLGYFSNNSLVVLFIGNDFILPILIVICYYRYGF